MPHDPDHKPIVDAIIDHELDAAALAEEAYQSGKTAMERVTKMLETIASMVDRGTLSLDHARRLWTEGFTILVLNEHVKIVERLKLKVDGSSQRMIDESKKLGARIRKVGAIRNIDIKFRETEKKNAPK
jgi:hypothetical protein